MWKKYDYIDDAIGFWKNFADKTKKNIDKGLNLLHNVVKTVVVDNKISSDEVKITCPDGSKNPFAFVDKKATMPPRELNCSSANN